MSARRVKSDPSESSPGTRRAASALGRRRSTEAVRRRGQRAGIRLAEEHCGVAGPERCGAQRAGADASPPAERAAHPPGKKQAHAMKRNYLSQPARLCASTSAATAAVSARRSGSKRETGEAGRPDRSRLLASETTLGAHQHREAIAADLQHSGGAKPGPRPGGRRVPQREVGQTLRLGQRRRPAPAALCHGRGGDPPPALHAGGVPAALHQARDHRHERSGPQLGGLLHRPVERLGVEHAETKHEGRRGSPRSRSTRSTSTQQALPSQRESRPMPTAPSRSSSSTTSPEATRATRAWCAAPGATRVGPRVMGWPGVERRVRSSRGAGEGDPLLQLAGLASPRGRGRRDPPRRRRAGRPSVRRAPGNRRGPAAV